MKLRMYRCTAQSMDTDEDTIVCYYEASSRDDAMSMFKTDEYRDRWLGMAELVPERQHRRGLTHKVNLDDCDED